MKTELREMDRSWSHAAAAIIEYPETSILLGFVFPLKYILFYSPEILANYLIILYAQISGWSRLWSVT